MDSWKRTGRADLVVNKTNLNNLNYNNQHIIYVIILKLILMSKGFT